MSFEAMMDATRGLPDQLSEAVGRARGIELPGDEPEDVVAIGMGGSSIGGALSAALLERDASVPVGVVRDHVPPGHVGDGTLAVATSYSGNTQETLDATRAAVDRGADLVAITTGGELGELAEEHGAPVVEIPTGMQPRAAVGWLFGTNYTILSRALGVGDPSELASAAKHLEGTVDDLAAEGGPADQLAAELQRGPVGVVGHDAMGVVARRWAGEIAENAKRLAFHAVLPEMAHNQILGWAGEPEGTTLVLVRRAEESALEAARMDFLVDRASQAGALVLEGRTEGTGLDGLVEAILVGDLTSLHLARRKGIDPEPVDTIEALKDRLDEAGG